MLIVEIMYCPIWINSMIDGKNDNLKSGHFFNVILIFNTKALW